MLRYEKKAETMNIGRDKEWKGRDGGTAVEEDKVRNAPSTAESRGATIGTPDRDLGRLTPDLDQVKMGLLHFPDSPAPSEEDPADVFLRQLIDPRLLISSLLGSGPGVTTTASHGPVTVIPDAFPAPEADV